MAVSNDSRTRTPARPYDVVEHGGAPVRIERLSRWDALALGRELCGYRWHFVQTGPNEWCMCLRSEGATSELPDDLARRLQRWLAERGIAAVRVRLSDRDCIVKSTRDTDPRD